MGDWRSVVLTALSYTTFQASYPLLHQQLDQALRRHPVVFVGCSLRDPRVLGWLRGLRPREQKELFASRVLITRTDWAQIPEEDQRLLTACQIQPLLVDTHADITQVLERTAQGLAPLEPQRLEFLVTPDADGGHWTVVGPTAESAPRRTPSPLREADFLDRLRRLREGASTPVPVDAAVPAAQLKEATLWRLARELGARLTEALLSPEARAQVARRVHAVDRGRASLTVQARGEAGALADQVLALPWELLMPVADELAVHQHRLGAFCEPCSKVVVRLPARGPRQRRRKSKRCCDKVLRRCSEPHRARRWRPSRARWRWQWRPTKPRWRHPPEASMGRRW